METIVITYSELRNMIEDITGIFSKKKIFKGQLVCLRTRVNFDLGIDGDDWGDFIIELVENHNLKLDGFEFQKFFHDEGEISDNFIYTILLYPFVLLTFLIERGWRKQKFAEYFDDRSGNKREPLSIGDLIASKLSGKFIKRNQIQVKLVP